MNYTITFTAEELDLVGVALGKLPMEMALPLWTKLKNEVTAQQATQPIPELVTDVNDTPDNSAS